MNIHSIFAFLQIQINEVIKISIYILHTNCAERKCHVAYDHGLSRRFAKG